MEDFKHRADFRMLLRNKIPEYLGQLGYTLSFDNQNEDRSISKNWVFRLQYSGKKKIEIKNDDWRDYTEYFILTVNDEEIFMLNLNNYKNLDTAFEELISKLIDKI
jgi:hypothetical protein